MYLPENLLDNYCYLDTNPIDEVILNRKLYFVNNLLTLLVRQLEINGFVANSISYALFELMSRMDLKYHNYLHILTMFQFADRYNLKLKPEEELAIWFHDCIYDIRSCCNEYNSTILMRSMIDPHIKDYEIFRPNCEVIVNHACNYINSTSNHLNSLNDEFDSQLVLDLDLCSLNWEWKHFLKANENIDIEYVSAKVQIKDLYSRRAKFIQSLLDKPRIYRTEFFYDKFEVKARENLTRILKEKYAK